MNFNKLTDRQKIARDVYLGEVEKRSKGKYSHEQAEDKLRKFFLDAVGGEWNYLNFKKNKYDVFGLIVEVMPVLIQEGLQTQFDPLVDFRNVGFGEKVIFQAEDYHNFVVSKVAGGTNNVERQRLERMSYQVDTAWHEVKVYEEFERFISGQSDWAYTVNKVQRSFQSQMKADMYDCLTTGYNALAAPYKQVGSYDRTKFNTVVQMVEAATEQDVLVIGTKIALQNVTPQYVALAGSMVEDRNNLGYFKNVDGYDLLEVKQSIKPGTDTFAIANDFLLIVPKGDQKIIKMVMEGQPIVDETTTAMNNDNSVEFMYKQKYGVKVATSTKYGAYLLA